MCQIFHGYVSLLKGISDQNPYFRGSIPSEKLPISSITFAQLRPFRPRVQALEGQILITADDLGDKLLPRSEPWWINNDAIMI